MFSFSVGERSKLAARLLQTAVFCVEWVGRSMVLSPQNAVVWVPMDKSEEIKAAIPHREPFLFVDEIVECKENRILCKKTFHGDEHFFAGHYPDFPVVPGVLQCEAAMQAGAILLTRIFKDEDLGDRLPVVAKMGEVRFKQMVLPGDTLLLDVRFKGKIAGIYLLHAKVTVGDKTSAQFDIACALIAKPEGL